MGLDLLVKNEADRLPPLNAAVIPDGGDDAAVRACLWRDFNLEIGVGLGSLAGKVWRIGLLGHAGHAKTVECCSSSLDPVLGNRGVIEQGVAVAAARSIFKPAVKILTTQALPANRR